MKQRGDTIVEVLIAIVIIGLVLGSAFATSNLSLAIGRSAQERSDALKLAESKIELIKVAHRTDTNSIRTRTTEMCIYSTGSSLEVDDINVPPENCEGVNAQGVKVAGSLYTVTARGVTTGGVRTYTVTVIWDRIGTNSTESGKLSLYYRPGQL